MLPPDYDEATTKTIAAYDAEGNVQQLDAKVPPKQAVVVVGANERATMENGLLNIEGIDVPCVMMQERYPNARVSNCSTIDDGGGGGGGYTPPPPPPPTPGGCYFQDGKWLYLSGIKFTDIGRYEGWPAGAPEIDVRVYAPSKSKGFAELGELRYIDDLEPRERRDINDRWWDPNKSIVVWHQADYGKSLMFHFVEDDAEIFIRPKEVEIGGSFKVKLPLVGEASLSLKVKFDIGTMDEPIGNIIVDQCEAPPHNYDGMFYDAGAGFRFKLRN